VREPSSGTCSLFRVARCTSECGAREEGRDSGSPGILAVPGFSQSRDSVSPGILSVPGFGQSRDSASLVILSVPGFCESRGSVGPGIRSVSETGE